MTEKGEYIKFKNFEFIIHDLCGFLKYSSA